MHHTHHRARKRNAILKPILIGLAVFVIIGGEGLLYQQMKKTKPYTFDAAVFAEPAEHQQVVDGTITAQANCTNPVVVSGEDSAAINPETLDRQGRPVVNGTFKTVVRKDKPTYLSVYDDAGVLCLAGDYSANNGVVTITPQITASVFNPLRFDVAVGLSTVPLQNLPSYPAFYDYLSSSLATNLLSQTIAATQYESLVSKLQSEAAASIPAS